MRYIDTDGDEWETLPGGTLRVVRSDSADTIGLELSRASVERSYGPLRPLVASADDAEQPSDGLPSVSDVMSRAGIFQSAHALVTGLEWDQSEKPSVYDVLSVAKWLEGEG